MPSITTIKHEREFYKDFRSLVNVLKTVAISQFQAENGLEVTGEATPQLLGMLQAPAER